MSSSIQVAEEIEPKAEDLPIDRPRKSGFVIKPIDVEKAIATLRSFYGEDEEEQRETFEYLKRALNEGRAERGERLIYIEDE